MSDITRILRAAGAMASPARRRTAGHGMAVIRGIAPAAAPAPDSGPQPSRVGWLAQFALDAGLVALALAAAIGHPPLWECHIRDKAGFYAGDTFEKCLWSKIGARVSRLDQSVKMIALGSGR